MKDIVDQVKSQFYVGAYQAVQSSLVSASSLDANQQVLCKVYKFRSLIALGNHAAVLGELQQFNHPEFKQIISLMVEHASGKSSNNVDAFVQRLKSCNVSSGLSAAMLGEILIGLGRLEDAVGLMAPHVAEDLECCALAVQLLLRLNRADLAEKQMLSQMKSIAEDATIVQLAEAWINVAKGNEFYQDAFYIYQELLETYGMTSKLLNSQSVCQMAMSKFDDAERLLMDALSKNSQDADTLANLITCLSYRRKPVDNYHQQLMTIAPAHAILKEREMKSLQFDQACQQFH